MGGGESSVVDRKRAVLTSAGDPPEERFAKANARLTQMAMIVDTMNMVVAVGWGVGYDFLIRQEGINEVDAGYSKRVRPTPRRLNGPPRFKRASRCVFTIAGGLVTVGEVYRRIRPSY